MRTVTIQTPGDLRTFRTRLEQPGPLLASIGLQLKRTSDLAFDQQALGEIPWAARYPSQPEPFVNTAAVLQHANRGGEPMPRHFDRRPALRGTGDLQRSVHSNWGVTTTGAVVNTRSDLFYSGTQQKGGTVSFEVTQTARDVLRAWALKQTDAAAVGARGVRARLTPCGRKIMLLSYLHNWAQDVIARPFIGITDEASKRITQISEAFFAEGAA